MKNKKLFLSLFFVLLGLIVSSIASADGDISVTQNGNQGQTPAWRVQNNYDVYVNVRFTQASYDVTMYMAPGEVRLVGNPEPQDWFACIASDGTPVIKGTNDEPLFGTPHENVECRIF